MTAFTIEKNVPHTVPRANRKGVSKYPFSQMEVGDSFLIPDVGEREGSTRSYMSTASRQVGIKVSCGMEGTSLRVWRVA